LHYNNNYWPENITSVHDEDILSFIENNLYLVPLKPRDNKYNVLENTCINQNNVKQLAQAAENCWNAIINKDINLWGKYTTEAFKAQIKMFPNMMTQNVLNAVKEYENITKGYKITGAGGGGYLVLVNDKPISNAVKIKIRRK
ncbi:MAG: cytidyltransferase, partial [Bacteroidaceae bacterium]|nr:cytidyltransferase [Bacteroidaceae bacterium]